MTSNNKTIASYPIHVFCLLIPEVDKETFAEIVDSIKNDGLLEPIVLYDGKILDGRTRYNACKEANVEPEFVQFEEVCPNVKLAVTQQERDHKAFTFVFTKNCYRRHLNTSQPT